MKDVSLENCNGSGDGKTRNSRRFMKRGNSDERTVTLLKARNKSKWGASSNITESSFCGEDSSRH